MHSTTTSIGLRGLLLALVLSLGCDKPRPSLPVDRVDTSTPTGQFEWAMKKLERAVLEFQPSAEDGLQVGKRRVKYKIYPPDDEKDHYTALVTIESETVYVHEEPLDELEQKREANRRERAAERFEQQVKSNDETTETTDPLEEKFVSQMKELATKSHPPRGPEPILKSPEVSVRKEYELAHLDGHWQLQTTPETDYERLWFEYALRP